MKGKRNGTRIIYPELTALKRGAGKQEVILFMTKSVKITRALRTLTEGKRRSQRVNKNVSLGGNSLQKVIERLFLKVKIRSQ